MHLFDQRILGIAILFLLGMMVTVKRITTGSVLDRPQGNLMVQLVNIFNLFFLLVVNPLAAISVLIDHDVVDGADMVRFLSDLSGNMENGIGL